MALDGDHTTNLKSINLEETQEVKSPSEKGRKLLHYLATRTRVPYKYGHVVNYARNHVPFLYRMNLMKKLAVHEGCVNTICWNKTGEYILSGSDDCALCITKPSCIFDDTNDYTVLHKIPTRHLGNIFGARFLPNTNDSIIVSCSSEGPVIVHDVNATNPTQGLFNYNCHASTIFDVVPLPDDDKVFFSCGEDKTVRLFDLRCHKSCARASTCPHPSLIRNSHAVTTLSIHPLNSNLILIGRADGTGLTYDRRKLPDVSKFSREKAHEEYLAGLNSSFRYLHPLDGVISQFSVPDMSEKCRFTSLCFSERGDQVLASYSQEYIYLFNLDRSTKFELVQTLPRSSPIKTDSNDDSEREASQTSRGHPTGATRAPRIRLRGDWSGTGVSSQPQQPPNFLQRMTEMAFLMSPHRFNVARHVPRSEIIEGRNIPGNDSSNATIDEEQDGEFPEESERNLGSENAEENSDHNEDDGSDKVNTQTQEEAAQNYGKDGRAKSRSKVSEETKMKFRKSFDSLKDKYSKIPTYHPRVRYQGHRNSRTTIKEAIFWGDDYIMSGSDCGRIMVWEKENAKLLMAFPADERVVNSLAPNPHHYALASSGIDYDIKLWSTQNILDCPLKMSQREIDAMIKNNEIMLEEAKQTIIVPPHLFFRVLASLAQNRVS